MARRKLERHRYALLFLVFGMFVVAPTIGRGFLIGCLIVGGGAALIVVAPLLPELFQRLFTGAIALRVPDEEIEMASAEAEACPDNAGRRHQGGFRLPE